MRYDPHHYESAGTEPDGNSAAVVVWIAVSIGRAIGTGILGWALWRVVAG